MSIGSWLSKKGDQIGDAFSSKNGKDPFSRIGGMFSPSTQLLKKVGVDFEGINNSVADWSNKQLSDVLNTDNQKGGVAGWVGNKPATTIGAMQTGGMMAGSAMGGGAAPPTVAPAAPPAPATPPPAAPAGFNPEMYQRYLQMFPQQQSPQENTQAGASTPAPTAVPQPVPQQVAPTAAAPAQASRSRLDASLNPSLGQLVSNYGGGY